MFNWNLALVMGAAVIFFGVAVGSSGFVALHVAENTGQSPIIFAFTMFLVLGLWCAVALGFQSKWSGFFE